MATAPNIQGSVRLNAEAFLGSRIVACEGPTEIGCLRAYDLFRFDAENPPVWSLATSYFNCGSGGQIKIVCPKLMQLGYKTAALCDNDAQDQLSDEDIRILTSSGVHICQWDRGNSTEHQLFADLPWRNLHEMLAVISDSHDTLEYATLVDCIRKEPDAASLGLSADPNTWPESVALRKVIGGLIHRNKWIKRPEYAARTFNFAFQHLPNDCVLMTKLAALWTWVQMNV
jgi:putative ATP-dependent endonuclease of the OLD family